MKKKVHYLIHMVRTKVIMLFAVMLLLLFFLLAVFGFCLGEAFFDKLAETNSGLLRYYAGVIESEFNATELFFMEQRLQQSLYFGVENAQNELDQYLAAYDVRQFFENSLYEADCLDYIFLYSPNNNTFVQWGDEELNGQEQTLGQFLREQVGTVQLPQARWTLCTTGKRLYLCYVVSVHQSWVGGIVDVEKLMEQIAPQQTGSLQSILLLDSSHLPITGNYNMHEKADIQNAIKNNISTVNIQEHRYRISQAEIDGRSLCLIGLTAQDTISEQIFPEIVVLLVGTLVLLGIGIGLLLTLWQSLILPLSRVTDGMLELKKGNFSYQLQPEKSSEFAQITATFNAVGREIETLKLAVYEEQLERQRTELQFLHSQLNPHFVINCLNGLRTLVLQGKNDGFQSMLTELGTYLRGSMTMRRLIPLEQEIKNVTAYAHLQRIRYQDRFQIDIHIDEELLPIPVPVHVIQTFVENAIKYGFPQEGPLNVTVRGELSTGQYDKLILHIWDNGPGFSNEVLEQLRNGNPVLKDGRECVGIANVATRLHLIFDEPASIGFRNREEGGAYICVIVPIEEGEW